MPAAGEVWNVKRSVLVLVAMVAVVAAVVWAGAHNLKARRARMQAQEERQAAMMPDIKQAPGDEAMDTVHGAPSPLQHKPAPPFTLKQLDGKTVSLSDFKGKPLVVNFWATWCGPCKVEMPWFEEFRKKYAAEGFEVIGVADDSDAGNDVIAKSAQEAGRHLPDSAGRHDHGKGIRRPRSPAHVLLRR